MCKHALEDGALRVVWGYVGGWSGDQEVRLHPLHHLAPSSKDGLHVRPALTTVQDKTAKHGLTTIGCSAAQIARVPVVIDFFTLDDEHVEECTGLNILWPCLRYGRRSACVHALQPERVRARACVRARGWLAGYGGNFCRVCVYTPPLGPPERTVCQGFRWCLGERAPPQPHHLLASFLAAPSSDGLATVASAPWAPYLDRQVTSMKGMSG